MNKREAATLIGELKGAAASITLALTILKQPLTLPELGIITRYSPPTLRAAIDRLALLGFIQEEQHLGQYTLTTQARQFILGEVGLALEDTDEKALPVEKNFFLAHVVSNVNLPTEPEEKTLLTDVSEQQKLFTWNDDAEDTVKLLIEAGRWERTKAGKGARDSVEAALAAGWTGAQCYNHVIDCLRYARSKAGKGINDPGAWAAYALREQMPAPHYTLEPGDPDYLEWKNEQFCASIETGPYAGLIQH